MRETPSGEASRIEEVGLIAALREAITEEFGSEFGVVEWSVPTQAEAKALELPATTASVVYHAAREAIRNAARHGRGGDPSRVLHLSVVAEWQDGLALSIADDGVGLYSGDGTTGGGHGLEMHSTMLAIVGGSLVTESPPGGGTRVILHAPCVSGNTSP
jgi:signal transduction histidine kinase